MSRLLTTTIGSLHRFDPDLHASIDKAIAFQREHLIDVLSDGEQRTDMVSYFAESFEGLGIENGAPVITGKIALRKDPKEFSKVEDLQYVRRKFPDLPIKVAITGPTTLGMTCGSRKIKSHYKGLSDFALYEDIAEALAPISKAIVNAGALLQIDEPFLSQGFKDLDSRVGLLDRVASGLTPDKVSVHVCGFIGRYGVVNHLAKLGNVSILSFAFSGRLEQGNINHVTGSLLEEHGKRLGAGCISVTPLKESDVDTPEAVADKLRELSKQVGRENIAFAHPDCGMRATNKSCVPVILRNLRTGVNLFG